MSKQRKKTWDAWPDWPGYGEVGVPGTRRRENLLVTCALVAHGFPGTSQSYGETWAQTQEDALLAFKHANGIKEGGVGPATWSRLGEATDEEPTAARTPATALRAQALLVLAGESLRRIVAVRTPAADAVLAEYRGEEPPAPPAEVAPVEVADAPAPDAPADGSPVT